MNPVELTRRHLFSRCAFGLGGLALASLTGGVAPAAASGESGSREPMQPRKSHFPPRARNVIYLFMAGGPSQLELFDYKPRLNELSGKPIPRFGRRDCCLSIYYTKPVQVRMV